MTRTPEPIPVSPIVWGRDGAPRSRLFDDVYFSQADGLAESRAVFLAGCGLPEAWAGRDRFVVGELGFGTGLNILALLDLWRRTCEPGARLRIFSVEAYPLCADEARRALAAWPALAEQATLLLDRWPRRSPGLHRVDLEPFGATLDLAVMDAEAALRAWTGRADAWFLDGFAPARNPGMWSPAVLQGIAARSAPGARLATFTVAGAVRRGLRELGFTVEKRPGFGHKRERLEAVGPAFAAPRPVRSAAPRIALIGAGIAGAALARAFKAQGVRPLIIEAETVGAGASGNSAALVMPRLDAGGGGVARLYAQAFARAVDLYRTQPEAVIARGVLQLELGPKDPSRFDRIAGDGLFEPAAVRRLDAVEASARLGEATTSGGLDFAEGLVVDPAAILNAWLSGLDVRRGQVAALRRDDGGWRLLDAAGQTLAQVDVVCLAAGAGTSRLAPEAPLSAVRGQVSLAAAPHPTDPPAAAIWGGYVIPTRDGLLFGATHDRDRTDPRLVDADHARNLALLTQGRPKLAGALAGAELGGRAAIRAVTPDFLPLAGAAAAAGVFVLSGLGSRGFCAAPLLAEHVAALALDIVSPIPCDLQTIIDPARFLSRARRRRGRWP